MAKIDTLEIELTPEVSESAARFAACLLELFLKRHPDYNLRVLDGEDGTGYRLVKKDEPCVSG